MRKRPISPVRQTPAPSSSNATPAVAATPIATPASDAAVLNSRIRVAVQALGSIPFDGQTLPLVSPDGRFIATQVGPTPSWPTLLAEPGAPLAATHIERFELTANGPRALEPPDLPPGALLGRQVTGHGFSVFVPHHHAHREVLVPWIGDSHAEMPATARAPANSAAMLAIDVGSGRTAWLELDGAETLSLAWRSSAEAPISRRALAHRATAMTAFQTFAPFQSPMLVPHANRVPLDPPGVLFFHPSTERVALCLFTTGEIVMLAEQSVAAAWHAEGERWGVFLTTPDGLQYQALIIDSRGAIRVAAPVRVFDVAYVPRATYDLGHPYVLIGPGPSATQLQLMWMTPAPSP